MFIGYFEHILWKKKRKAGDGVRIVNLVLFLFFFNNVKLTLLICSCLVLFFDYDGDIFSSLNNDSSLAGSSDANWAISCTYFYRYIFLYVKTDFALSAASHREPLHLLWAQLSPEVELSPLVLSEYTEP